MTKTDRITRSVRVYVELVNYGMNYFLLLVCLILETPSLM